MPENVSSPNAMSQPAPQGQARVPSELLIWLSPAFPVGAFAYSQGLEAAVETGWVSDKESLGNWLHSIVCHGSVRNELILLSLVMRASCEDEIASLSELSNALQPSSERAFEARDQGLSFWNAYQAAWRVDCEGDAPTIDTITLPIAVARAAREHNFDHITTLEFYGAAFVSNQISAAIRLGVVGQFDGQKIVADLLSDIRDLSVFAAQATPNDLGSATFGADLASMLHETQTTRLFRS